MDLKESYKYCRSLKYSGMDYPLLAANLLSAEKRDSIAACLASFRAIIDRVHAYFGDKSLAEAQIEKIRKEIAAWEGIIDEAQRGKCADRNICPALADTFARFDLPLRPWSDFKNALEFHLNHIDIPDEKVFHDYCRWTYGASLYAFVHIMASRREAEGFRPHFKPEFLSDDLASLLFIVHTLTDIDYDLTGTQDGFVFIPRTVLEKYDLSREDLQDFHESGEIDDRFRALIDKYYHLGREYELYAREKLVLIRGEMQKEEWFLLDLLLNIYSNFLHRIWEHPGAIFNGGYPLDPAMLYINALKLQSDLGLKFEQDISRLLNQTVA